MVNPKVIAGNEEEKGRLDLEKQGLNFKSATVKVDILLLGQSVSY